MKIPYILIQHAKQNTRPRLMQPFVSMRSRLSNVVSEHNCVLSLESLDITKSNNRMESQVKRIFELNDQVDQCEQNFYSVVVETKGYDNLNLVTKIVATMLRKHGA